MTTSLLHNSSPVVSRSSLHFGFFGGAGKIQGEQLFQNLFVR
jgi:hypothetical protein